MLNQSEYHDAIINDLSLIYQTDHESLPKQRILNLVAYLQDLEL
jgi:hypothetical protein